MLNKKQLKIKTFKVFHNSDGSKNFRAYTRSGEEEYTEEQFKIWLEHNNLIGSKFIYEESFTIAEYGKNDIANIYAEMIKSQENK